MNQQTNQTPIQRALLIPTGVHIRAAADGEPESRTITGRAILFGQRSAALWDDGEERAYEVIDKSAITRELLDKSDIKFNLYHDNQHLLARSNQGQGTLRYDVDDAGVTFEFDAPNTIDGDTALELVRRGDITGCSFAFTVPYWDTDYVSREVVHTDGGKVEILYTVRAVKGVHDMSLVVNPAYPDTHAELRELMHKAQDPDAPEETTWREQIEEMQRAAKTYDN
jgi:caudovirus prohead protease|nr:MAG TPA: prohead serine protease [Caudoviricetes sp.]